jgi:hypothetical protein
MTATAVFLTGLIGFACDAGRGYADGYRLQYPEDTA